jgi:hypothetical protein
MTHGCITSKQSPLATDVSSPRLKAILSYTLIPTLKRPGNPAFSPLSLSDNSGKPVTPQALWSAAACCRFAQAGLPAVHRSALADGREQAR